ncbi:MAG: TOBE domain-containing protein [Rothia sp.]|nr:TOBE domain-containing protein [Rothia sp. (in: high G+C Gram-positive bacteria)]
MNPILQLPRLAYEAVKVITDNRIEELGLKVGETAYAVIKASSVMVGADN